MDLKEYLRDKERQLWAFESSLKTFYRLRDLESSQMEMEKENNKTFLTFIKIWYFLFEEN